MRTRATWVHPKRAKPETGEWFYNRFGGYFTITLDSVDPVTEQKRVFHTWGEEPEWGKWKRKSHEADRAFKEVGL